MEKKFGLISSMMKRLGLTPRVFISQCIKGNKLALKCSVSDESSTITLIPSSYDEHLQDENSQIVELKEPKQSTEITEEPSNVIPKETETNFDKMFYAEIEHSDPEEFELNKDSQNKVKCGMFVYADAKGTKVIIRKNPMLLKLMRHNSLEFKGIMFANKEDNFLVIRFGEEHCGYNRAVRKLIKGYKMLDNSDCIALFVYLDRICEAFKKLHTANLRKIDKIFYLDTTDSTKDTPRIFSLKQGSTVTDSGKFQSAGFMQVLTIKKL